jgi:DNA-binding PadR family transcriptional regulator
MELFGSSCRSSDRRSGRIVLDSSFTVTHDMSETDMSRDDLALGPAAFHILLALADRPSHGYAVMRLVREQSAGRVPLQTGSFYWHLTRLIEQGLVAEAPTKLQQDSRRGTHYRLTPRGRQVLGRELRYLENLLTAHRGLVPARKDQG